MSERWQLLEGDAYDWSVQKPGLLPQRGGHVVEILNNLEAECARYKAALEEIAKDGVVTGPTIGPLWNAGYNSAWQACRDIASQALEPTAEKASEGETPNF